MDFNELTRTLRSAELYPIHVEGSADKRDANGLVFIGNLDEFIEAVKAIKATIVFVSNRPLEESDFVYQSTHDEDLEDDVEADLSTEVYLPAVVPALEEFKKYIGKDCFLKLSAPMSSSSLDLYIEEEWCSRFIEQRRQAIDKVDVDREAILAKLVEQREAEKGKLLNRLRSLLSDSEFTSLTTQRAMLAYVLEKIPDLESLDRSILKAEIQSLDDKIKVKGPNRKR